MRSIAEPLWTVPFCLNHLVRRSSILLPWPPKWATPRAMHLRPKMLALQDQDALGGRYAEQHRDRPCGEAEADRRSRARPRHPRRGRLQLRALQGQDRPQLAQPDRPARRPADPRHRGHADHRRRGQDDHHGRPRRRAQPHRQEGRHLPPRAVARPVLRHEGRGGRRRLQPGDPDGGHQPPFHRRLRRDRRRQQPPRGDGRQPHLLGQRARHRPAPRHLAARPRHERPGAPQYRLLARRRRQRLSPRGRLRHRRRVGGDGDLLPRHRHRRPGRAARADRRRRDPRPEAGHRRATSTPTARWRCCSRRRCRRTSSRPSRATPPSSMAGPSPTSPMAATRWWRRGPG